MIKTSHDAADTPYLQQCLLALLRDDLKANTPLPDITPSQWKTLLDLARRQHVREYLYYRLKQKTLLELLPPEQQGQLAASFKRKTFQNLKLIAELQRISKALHAAAIPVIALKGLHLIESVYPHIATRSLRDLDLLIPLKDAKSAYRCVQELGYTSEKQLTDIDMSFAYHHHLYQQIHPIHKTVVELHGYIAYDFRGSPERIWERTLASRDAQSPHLLLDLEELLITLCVHISYSDHFKIDLRHYLDIYVLLQNNTGIDWSVVRQRAEEQNWMKGVSLVLLIVSQLFPLKVPESILADALHDDSSKVAVDYALEFLWLYDKSSQEYQEYKSRTFIKNRDQSFINKVIKSIFIDREELAYKYALNEKSGWIYLYYLIRVFDLFKTYTLPVLSNRFHQKSKSFREKTEYVSHYLYR